MKYIGTSSTDKMIRPNKPSKPTAKSGGTLCLAMNFSSYTIWTAKKPQCKERWVENNNTSHKINTKLAFALNDLTDDNLSDQNKFIASDDVVDRPPSFICALVDKI